MFDVGLGHYLTLGAIIFTIGLIGIFLVFLLTLIDLGTFDLIISLKNVIVGVSVSTFIGFIAGFFPALFASNLDPVEAIRSN